MYSEERSEKSTGVVTKVEAFSLADLDAALREKRSECVDGSRRSEPFPDPRRT